jgi:hypothetical protein
MKHKLLILFFALAFVCAGQTVRNVTKTALIPVNTATSAAVSLGQCWPIGFIAPTGWTTAAISVSFSANGTTYYPVQDRYGSKLTWAATAATWTVVDMPAETWGARSMKVESVNASTGAAVNQTGVADSTRTVTIVCR